MKDVARSLRSRRAVALQTALVVLILALAWFFYDNARTNIAAQRMKTGLDFFWNTAASRSGQTPIPSREPPPPCAPFVVGPATPLLFKTERRVGEPDQEGAEV